jgi:hypothetical protein
MHSGFGFEIKNKGCFMPSLRCDAVVSIMGVRLSVFRTSIISSYSSSLTLCVSASSRCFAIGLFPLAGGFGFLGVAVPLKTLSKCSCQMFFRTCIMSRLMSMHRSKKGSRPRIHSPLIPVCFRNSSFSLLVPSPHVISQPVAHMVSCDRFFGGRLSAGSGQSLP